MIVSFNLSICPSVHLCSVIKMNIPHLCGQMETVCKSVGDSCGICIYASSTSSQKSAANTGKLLDVHVQPANQGCGELAEDSNKTDSLYRLCAVFYDGQGFSTQKIGSSRQEIETLNCKLYSL